MGGFQVVAYSMVAVMAGLATSLCAWGVAKRRAAKLSMRGRACGSAVALVLWAAGLVGLLWCFLSPPPFSVEVEGPPEYHRNDPSRSIYLGQGCFWHTQYDFFLLEQDPQGPFGGRGDANITSLVGYAGGRYESPSGAVCYHGFPHTDYNRLGHAEAVSVTLDAITGPSARAQVAALAKFFFEHGYTTVDGGKRQRLDPQDVGAEYRSVIGLPGGMDNAELWPIFAAANVHNMPLVRGEGGPGCDSEGEFVVYVYDSERFPFFRAEGYHQFHTNDVLGRPVPESYTGALKRLQIQQGRLDDFGCVELLFTEITFLIAFGFAVVLGLGCVVISVLLCLPVCSRYSEQRAATAAAREERAVIPF